MKHKTLEKNDFLKEENTEVKQTNTAGKFPAPSSSSPSPVAFLTRAAFKSTHTGLTRTLIGSLVTGSPV